MEVEDIARVAHELNAALCLAFGQDPSQKWGDAPVWVRDSYINGVKFVQSNPSSSPRNVHDNWCADKAAAGWTHGEAKDPVKKEHPCMVPYDSLPMQHRVKDYVFRQAVHSLTEDASDE